MARKKDTNESSGAYNRVAALLAVPMFTAGEVVQFCKIKPETLQTWLARRLINVRFVGDKGPGRGRYRLFNLTELIQVAIMDDLVSRFGVTPAIASQISAAISKLAQVKLIGSTLGLPKDSFMAQPKLTGFWIWTGTDASGKPISRWVQTGGEMCSLVGAPTHDIGVVIRLESVQELIIQPALDTMTHKVATGALPDRTWAILAAVEEKENQKGK